MSAVRAKRDGNTRRLRPAVLAALVTATLGAATRPARAAGGDVASAEVLFEESRRRMAEGDYAAACPKLEESQRLAPAVGTEFNLADCWEHVDRLASAWAAFLEVAELTHRRGETERERLARDRAAALEPRVGHVVVAVPAAHRVAQLQIVRDGQAIQDALGTSGSPSTPASIASRHAHRAAAPGPPSSP